jgi:hypothetical protein
MHNIMSHTITDKQFRMAKAGLKLSNLDVSEVTGLHRNTLNGVDAGKGSESTLTHLRIYFESMGVKFIDENGGGAGVRLVRNSAESAKLDE